MQEYLNTFIENYGPSLLALIGFIVSGFSFLLKFSSLFKKSNISDLIVKFDKDIESKKNQIEELIQLNKELIDTNNKLKIQLQTIIDQNNKIQSKG